MTPAARDEKEAVGYRGCWH